MGHFTSPYKRERNARSSASQSTKSFPGFIRLGGMEHPVPFTESGCTPPGEKIPTRHHPEGIDPDQMFFQEARVHELILSYQRDGDPQTWQAIVMACLPLIDSLIRKFNFQLFESVEALRNECVVKLSKAIRHYNPERGRAFSC